VLCRAKGVRPWASGWPRGLLWARALCCGPGHSAVGQGTLLWARALCHDEAPTAMGRLLALQMRTMSRS
jgi:hypothetical protein